MGRTQQPDRTFSGLLGGRWVEEPWGLGQVEVLQVASGIGRQVTGSPSSGASVEKTHLSPKAQEREAVRPVGKRPACSSSLPWAPRVLAPPGPSSTRERHPLVDTGAAQPLPASRHLQEGAAPKNLTEVWTSPTSFTGGWSPRAPQGKEDQRAGRGFVLPRPTCPALPPLAPRLRSCVYTRSRRFPNQADK